MPEFEESNTFFSCPVKDSIENTTEPYIIKMPRTIPQPARNRLYIAARKAIQDEVDKMKPEEFEFNPKKD